MKYTYFWLHNYGSSEQQKAIRHCMHSACMTVYIRRHGYLQMCSMPKHIYLLHEYLFSCLDWIIKLETHL